MLNQTLHIVWMYSYNMQSLVDVCRLRDMDSPITLEWPNYLSTISSIVNNFKSVLAFSPNVRRNFHFSNPFSHGYISLLTHFPICLFQCWENCQLLQSNFPVWWGTICDEKRICVSFSVSFSHSNPSGIPSLSHPYGPIILTLKRRIVKDFGWPLPTPNFHLITCRPPIR